MDTEEYIIASIKIPIRLTEGGKNTIPCQERCQIEFYRCDNLDEFPENNSLESNVIMSKFSQLFSSVATTPVETQPQEPIDIQTPSKPPQGKEIVVSKKYPSKQKTFRFHPGHSSSMRFTRRVYP